MAGIFCFEMLLYLYCLLIIYLNWPIVVSNLSSRLEGLTIRILIDFFRIRLLQHWLLPYVFGRTECYAKPLKAHLIIGTQSNEKSLSQVWSGSGSGPEAGRQATVDCVWNWSGKIVKVGDDKSGWKILKNCFQSRVKDLNWKTHLC